MGFDWLRAPIQGKCAVPCLLGAWHWSRQTSLPHRQTISQPRRILWHCARYKKRRNRWNAGGSSRKRSDNTLILCPYHVPARDTELCGRDRFCELQDTGKTGDAGRRRLEGLASRHSKRDHALTATSIGEGSRTALISPGLSGHNRDS